VLETHSTKKQTELLQKIWHGFTRMIINMKDKS